jgi:hypothetical protein
MHRFAMVLAAGAAILAGSGLQARERLTGEEKLEKLLEGRVAGEPVSCISLTGSRDSQVIDKTAIVYGSGRTIYVNRPHNAGDLDDDDILVTTLHGGGSQLCRLDIVRTHDRTAHFYTGFVNLDNFVPYRRVASRN